MREVMYCLTAQLQVKKHPVNVSHKRDPNARN